MSKRRVEIPRAIAAQVLFSQDRTCCVCRVLGKPVQIHHIDDNPSNNVSENLAVLCFDCHRETQLQGGFDRKLNSDQVLLYRDDWVEFVSRKRVAVAASQHIVESHGHRRQEIENESNTSLAEIYRENCQYSLLAIHYHSVPNQELRDTSDSDVVFLRGIQDRADLIPVDVIERRIKRMENERDWTGRARLFNTIHRPLDAVRSYLQGINESLSEGRTFSAAFYLKELAEEGLIDELFSRALQEAVDEKDLWWQIRSLQELGWESELTALLNEHADSIRESGDLMMLELLAMAEGDYESQLQFRKTIAKSERSHHDGMISFTRKADE